MALNLKLLTVLEKNRLVSHRPELLLVQVQWDPINNPLDIDYIVADNQPFTYQGTVYSPCPLQLKNKTSKTSGELSACTILVSNVNRLVESEIVKYNGAVDANVTLIAVNSDVPDGDPELVQTYSVLTTSTAEDWCTFNLGMQNPIRQPFPLRTYMADRCFKPYNSPSLQAALDPLGAPCGYEGPLPTCDRTLNGSNGCKVHGNLINGGFCPGINVAGYRRAY